MTKWIFGTEINEILVVTIYLEKGSDMNEDEVQI